MRLGHITYSNCFPVHARLIDRPESGDPELIGGIPSFLNALLERREIDVSPSSSIEFARHADRYTVLPDLVIGSRGAVRSILFLSDRSPADLDGATVAVPSASATSVVLLKILLRHRWGVRPRFVWFDQATGDPFRSGAAAALFIGDVALRPDLFPALPLRLDLGSEWSELTGLPFAFAIWQASDGDPGAMRALHRRLIDSRTYGMENRGALAQRHHARFDLPAAMLADYWSGLSYTLDAEMLAGLLEFYRLAVEIGELTRAPEVNWAF